MDQLRPELDNVLQSLSSNGYSVFSLIDGILARCNGEDERIKILREGMERDAADICARLLCHATVTSGPARILKFGTVQFKIHRHDVLIDILPDNVFLEIFSFCIEDPFAYFSRHTRNWRTLAHVCQRWREIIFASPQRLGLHLICSHGTPVQENLVFWPVTLPLVVNYPRFVGPISPEDEDNIVAAFEHPGRVRHIHIFATAPQIKKVVNGLRKSFPVLTGLELECKKSVSPVISRGFLGESNIPLLQHLTLSSISFPQLPTPFSSALNLVSLHIDVIPGNGYISPDAMVRALAALTKLKTLFIQFYEDMPPSDSDSSTSHPQMRTVLPALTRLNYEDGSEYVEDFLAQIDAPRVDSVKIDYLVNQNQVSQLSQFIERTETLKIDQFTRAKVYFYPDESLFGLNRSQEAWTEAHLDLKVFGEASLDDQVRDMAHLIGQLSTTFSRVDDLFLHGDNVVGDIYEIALRGDDEVELGEMDITEWLPLFRLFPAVETLRLYGKLAVSVTSALEDIPEEMVTDVFPALRLIRVVECNDGPKSVDEDDWMDDVASMERFLSLRQLSGFPVTVINPGDELAEVERRW